MYKMIYIILYKYRYLHLENRSKHKPNLLILCRNTHTTYMCLFFFPNAGNYTQISHIISLNVIWT